MQRCPIKDPLRRDLQDFRDTHGIENRDPTDTNSFRACGQPQRIGSDGNGIIEGSAVGEAPKLMALRRRPVGIDADLAGGVVETGELEPRIKGDAIRGLRLQRLLMARLETLADACAPRRIVDDHVAPGLA